jgi:hypothetical protein
MNKRTGNLTQVRAVHTLIVGVKVSPHWYLAETDKYLIIVSTNAPRRP